MWCAVARTVYRGRRGVLGNRLLLRRLACARVEAEGGTLCYGWKQKEGHCATVGSRRRGTVLRLEAEGGTQCYGWKQKGEHSARVGSRRGNTVLGGRGVHVEREETV